MTSPPPDEANQDASGRQSIRSERERLHLTQEELARRAGVSKRTVEKADGGEYIGAKSRRRILDALEEARAAGTTESPAARAGRAETPGRTQADASRLTDVFQVLEMATAALRASSDPRVHGAIARLMEEATEEIMGGRKRRQT